MHIFFKNDASLKGN